MTEVVAAPHASSINQQMQRSPTNSKDTDVISDLIFILARLLEIIES